MTWDYIRGLYKGLRQWSILLCTVCFCIILSGGLNACALLHLYSIFESMQWTFILNFKMANMIFSVFFLYFALMQVADARCYGLTNCKWSRILCQGVREIPELSLAFVENVKFLDLRRSRLNEMSQLEKAMD